MIDFISIDQYSCCKLIDGADITVVVDVDSTL